MRLNELQTRYDKLCRSIRSECGSENENLGSFIKEEETDRVRADVSRVENMEANDHTEKWQSTTNEKPNRKEESPSASRKRLFYEPQSRYFIDKAKKLSRINEWF